VKAQTLELLTSQVFPFTDCSSLLTASSSVARLLQDGRQPPANETNAFNWNDDNWSMQRGLFAITGGRELT